MPEFIKIDWEKVSQLCQAGCSGIEISSYFGIDSDTLYNACKREHNCQWSAYSVKHREKGESLLRAKQFETAMKGNTTMQVWLGKNRLGQTDQPKTDKEKEMEIALARADTNIKLMEKLNQFEKLLEKHGIDPNVQLSE